LTRGPFPIFGSQPGHLTHVNRTHVATSSVRFELEARAAFCTGGVDCRGSNGWLRGRLVAPLGSERWPHPVIDRRGVNDLWPHPRFPSRCCLDRWVCKRWGQISCPPRAPKINMWGRNSSAGGAISRARSQTGNALTAGLQITLCRTCDARSRLTAAFRWSRGYHALVWQP
jgi:hypothetical protein